MVALRKINSDEKLQIAGIYPANDVFTFEGPLDASYSLFTPEVENVLVLNFH